MIDVINKAIDMGWRVVKNDYGTMVLTPPDGEHAIITTQRMIGVPGGLEEWVKARELESPDLEKRNSLKHKVQTWFRLEWQSYIKECEDDVAYATDIILRDAVYDFSIDEYDAKVWFETRNQ